MKRIDENHSFNINVCVALDGHVQKAILLKEIYGWCHINQAKNHNYKKGLYWTFMSAKGFTKKFPYMKEKSIARWLKELEKSGMIFSQVFNKIGFDRTKWFTINFEQYDNMVLNRCISISQIDIWVSQIEKRISQDDTTIPSTTTTTNTSNTLNKKTIKRNSDSDSVPVSCSDSAPLKNETEKKKEKNSAKKRKKFTVADCVFPEVFENNPILKQTFLDFAEMRHEMKKGYKTKKGTETKLNSLAKDCVRYGIENVIGAINFSLESEYLGIFVHDFQKRQKQQQQNEKRTNNNGTQQTTSIHEDFARRVQRDLAEELRTIRNNKMQK